MPIEMDVELRDDASDLLKWMLATQPDWTRIILKSVGWMVQKEIKKGIHSGSPGGQNYPGRVDSSKRNELGELGNKSDFPWLGGLSKAVGYSYQDGKVVIGWTSNTAVWWGSRIEAGQTYEVTDKMRRWFFAHGVPISKETTSITIPARKTYGPEFAVVEPLIAPYSDQTIAEYLANGPPVSGSNTRKYRVFG